MFFLNGLLSNHYYSLKLNVMANYKPDVSYQNKFIPIDFAQQIIPGTFEFALSHIVDKYLDLTSFDEWYQNDHGGAAAYRPSVMLKLYICPPG